METIFILLAALVALNIAARKWGFDSKDGFNSPEWERRRSWKAFH